MIQVSGYITIFVVFLLAISFAKRAVDRQPEKYSYLNIFSFLVCSFVIFFAAICIWPVIYTDLRLAYLGAGISAEPAAWLETVQEKDKEEALVLYHSNMGVGWPIPTLLLFMVVGLPLSVIATAILKWRKYLNK